MVRIRIRKDSEKTGNADVRGHCYVYPYSTSLPRCPVDRSYYTKIHNRNFDAMLDVSTPEYKRHSAEGTIINSRMIKEYYTFVGRSSYCAFDHRNSAGNIFINSNRKYWENPRSMFLLSSTPELLVDDFLEPYQGERDVAITQAWANVDESEMMALATIGELPETLRWVASLYRRCIGIMAAFKAKRVRILLKRYTKKGVTSIADDLANSWLELRYALRPLMFEMEQVIALLDRNDKPNRQTARGHHEVVSENEDKVEVDFGTGRSYSCDEKTKRESNYRGGVLYDIKLTHDNFAELLGLDKPLESIWELTKLSFLLDWFFNVGDLLASFTTSSNLTPLSSWLTEEHVFSLTRNNGKFDTYAYTPDTAEIAAGEEQIGYRVETYHLTRRTPCPVQPMIPHIKINLDWAKVIDLGAIGRTIYRNFSKR